jgi:hypothetical protein
MGKVDGIILRVDDDAAPRVHALETGPVVAARRIHPRLADWLARLATRLGISPAPIRIPIDRVRKIGIEVVVDADAHESGADRWELWLRRHVIRHIPGSG